MRKTGAHGYLRAMAAETKSPTYLLVGEKVGADTMEWLEQQREAGTSWRTISRELYRQHDVDVTEVTLRKWWWDAHPAEHSEGVPHA